MKLYELPRNTYFTIQAGAIVPPDGLPVDTTTVYLLRRLDGMYSLCLDPDGNIVHVFGGADVTPMPTEAAP